MKKFEEVRPSCLTTFHTPFNHFNVSLKKCSYSFSECLFSRWLTRSSVPRGKITRRSWEAVLLFIVRFHSLWFSFASSISLLLFQSDDNINLTFLPVFRMVVMEIFLSQNNLGSHKYLPQLFLFITNECFARFLHYLSFLIFWFSTYITYEYFARLKILELQRWYGRRTTEL